eukprot:7379830-Prymnesium_polylepis.1
MHGMHYEGNVLLDETVQLPLAAAEDLDPAAKTDVLQATEEINTSCKRQRRSTHCGVGTFNSARMGRPGKRRFAAAC